MDNNNKMLSLQEICDIFDNAIRGGAKCEIPLLQRNYKWSRECAAELAEDLFAAYLENLKNPNDEDAKNGKDFLLNMITVHAKYDEQSRLDELQILDGQQRLITLKLFLTYLNSKPSRPDFNFQRDAKLNNQGITTKRRSFIDDYLKSVNLLNNISGDISVDNERLKSNYEAMLIPLSFKTVFDFYSDCLDEEKDNPLENQQKFLTQFNDRITEYLKRYGIELQEHSSNENPSSSLLFSEDEIEKCMSLCKDFQSYYSNSGISNDKSEEDEEASYDEIRISHFSDEFMQIWIPKANQLIKQGKRIDPSLANSLSDFIYQRVRLLFHETTSEPIEEFLNINEHKTRFVISDYIRANMISDNEIVPDADAEEKQKIMDNRREVLRVFEELGKYVYDEDYEKIWQLIKTRYDNFSKYTDINRMKVYFCDRYHGTSTKGYKFDAELQTLQYFEWILKSLAEELNINSNDSELYVNTYNAVDALLACKSTYRFFSIFSSDDVKNNIKLSDVTARERFCFFEQAYKLAGSMTQKEDDDMWDISYLLESQLHDEIYETHKSKTLPKSKEVIADDPWCYVYRGEDNDALNSCIKDIIKQIKSKQEEL